MPMNVSSWPKLIFKLWRIYRSHPSIKGLIHPKIFHPCIFPSQKPKTECHHTEMLLTCLLAARCREMHHLWVSYSIPNRPFVSIFEMPFSTQDTFVEHLPCFKAPFSLPFLFFYLVPRNWRGRARRKARREAISVTWLTATSCLFPVVWTTTQHGHMHLYIASLKRIKRLGELRLKNCIYPAFQSGRHWDALNN